MDLDYLRRLGALSICLILTDASAELALLDPAGPTPPVGPSCMRSVPCKYVDHTHADAVVLTVLPNGTELLQDLFGDEVLILPYTCRFVLARQVADATLNVDWECLRGSCCYITEFLLFMRRPNRATAI